MQLKCHEFKQFKSMTDESRDRKNVIYDKYVENTKSKKNLKDDSWNSTTLKML